MATVTLNIHMEIDETDDVRGLLSEIAGASVVEAVRADWMPGGRNLAGYNGPMVRNVTASYNGVEL